MGSKHRPWAAHSLSFAEAVLAAKFGDCAMNVFGGSTGIPGKLFQCNMCNVAVGTNQNPRPISGDELCCVTAS